MDKAEALQLLERHLSGYRTRTYDELKLLVRAPAVAEATGPSGAKYQIEVEAFWDDKPEGHLRLICAIDDGGWRAFAPLSLDFIMAPDGTFVGE